MRRAVTSSTCFVFAPDVRRSVVRACCCGGEFVGTWSWESGGERCSDCAACASATWTDVIRPPGQMFQPGMRGPPPQFGQRPGGPPGPYPMPPPPQYGQRPMGPPPQMMRGPPARPGMVPPPPGGVFGPPRPGMPPPPNPQQQNQQQQ